MEQNLIYAFKIDELGYIKGAEMVNPTNIRSNLITTLIPPNVLYRAKWTGVEWVEDMPQSEIDELNKPVDRPLSDLESLGQQMTERELEASAQGQQITDMDLRLYEMEVSKNV